MNIHKYIALGIIGLSAGGIQGMSWMQRMRTSCVPQLTQFAQKLTPYRYHIGGALALAAIAYGGYRRWKALQPCPGNKFPEHSRLSMHRFKYEEYEIQYSLNQHKQTSKFQDCKPFEYTSYKIAITSILKNNKKLTIQEIANVAWFDDIHQRIITSFMEHLRVEHVDKMQSEHHDDVAVQYYYGKCNNLIHIHYHKGCIATNPQEGFKNYGAKGHVSPFIEMLKRRDKHKHETLADFANL